MFPMWGAFAEYDGGVFEFSSLTHVHIRKLDLGPKDYDYFKSSGYSVQMQGIVDRHCRFLDVVVDMPNNMHNSKVLRRSSIYQQAN